MRLWLLAGAFLAVGLGGNWLLAESASDARARHAVENLGYTKVRVVKKGMAWGALGGCSDKDVAKFDVIGRDPSGIYRHVTVCAGVPFGGYTVRA